LRDAQRLHDLDSPAMPPPAPLRETAGIAAELRARIQRWQSQEPSN
jgi:uncharacterized protein